MKYTVCVEKDHPEYDYHIYEFYDFDSTSEAMDFFHSQRVKPGVYSIEVRESE